MEKENPSLILGSTGKVREPKKKVLPKYSRQTLTSIVANNQSEVNKENRLLSTIMKRDHLAVFWGPSGLGKSFLGYQIGLALAQGDNLFDVLADENYPPQEEHYRKIVNDFAPQKILYVDFEMSEKAIAGRMTEVPHKTYYVPNNNMEILIFQMTDVQDPFDYFLSIEEALTDSPVDMLIIDNLSSMCDRLEDADTAKKIMRKFEDLKRRYNLAILLIAHSNKVNAGVKLDDTQLKGSSNIKNFCDSMFSIGRGRTSTERYLKQTKCRHDPEMYGDMNVVVMELTQVQEGPRRGLTGFQFAGYAVEDKLIAIGEKTEDIEIKDFLRSHPDTTGTELANMKEFQKYRNKLDNKSFVRRLNRKIVKFRAEIADENHDEIQTILNQGATHDEDGVVTLG